MDDQEFEAIFNKSYGPIVDKWFYSKVAGAKFRNKDRTLRSRIIAGCAEFELLDLIPEPNNDFDPNALTIRRHETSEQLGYVNARAASEIAGDAQKNVKWFALLKNHNYHPETGKIVGANIVLARVNGGLTALPEPAVPRLSSFHTPSAPSGLAENQIGNTYASSPTVRILVLIGALVLGCLLIWASFTS